MGSIFDDAKTSVQSDSGPAACGAITPKEAKERMAVEPGILLLDVRTAAEYAQKRIPGALLMPVDTVAMQAPSILPDRDAVIFVYCKAGGRAATACAELLHQGYRHVFNLGGITSWPYATESGT